MMQPFRFVSLCALVIPTVTWVVACSATPTVELTRTLQLTAVPQLTQTLAPTAVPATLTATAIPATTTALPTPTRPLATATVQPSATSQPTATHTSIVLLSSPQLVQPQARASFAWNAPVILSWTWERSLQPDEYFQVQLSREGAELKDFGCIPAMTYVMAQPPLGYGWYQWRVLVRRGKIQGDQCTPQNDVSHQSEIRTFEWHLTPEPPTPRPYP